MASQSTAGVYDLRSAAVDYQRDRDSKHKWALGGIVKSGRSEADGKCTPVRPRQRLEALDRRQNQKSHRRNQVARKQPLVSDDNIHSDSSVDEDVVEASAAPEPDADITYSYDATHGPTHGSQILNTALSQAVERFENKVTDKLVKDEYEVLDGAEAEITGEVASALDEEEFEFV